MDMKRFDRSQELKKDRHRSTVIWAAISCIIAGPAILSVGHDYGNLFVSVSGIAVLLGGGVFLLGPSFLRRRRQTTQANVKAWRATLRSILVTGVFGCALATIGMLSYGFEYADSTFVRLGVLAMWLGVTFFIPTVFIPRSKLTYPDAVRLSLSNLTDARSLGLEWPDDETGLWVGIYDWNRVSSLDTRFLIANTPDDHRIFLAVSAWKKDGDHDELKNLLRAAGDQYLEEFEHGRRDEWHTIFASTRSENVMRHIFENYQFYYGSFCYYPFIVARGELDVWMDSLRRLLSRGMKGVARDMIENSFCVMITGWDHGLEMFTNKISEESVLKIARELASENSLPLINLGDEIKG